MDHEKEKKYMILSFVWSIVAACDLDSEGLRFLGEARYTLMGMWRLIALKQYFGTLSFTGQQIFSNDKKQLKLLSSFQPFTLNDEFKFLCILNTPFISQTIFSAPMSKIDDGTNDITMVTTDKSRI
jgi:sphingosine kinase